MTPGSRVSSGPTCAHSPRCSTILALGAEHVGRLLPAADDATARDFYDRYVGSRFKADGQPDPEVVARALPRVAEELRIITGRVVDAPPAEEIYRSDLTVARRP